MHMLTSASKSYQIPAKTKDLMTNKMWKLELDSSSASTTNLMIYIEHEMAALMVQSVSS